MSATSGRTLASAAIIALAGVLVAVGWLSARPSDDAPAAGDASADDAASSPGASDAPAPDARLPLEQTATRVPRPSQVRPSRRVVPPPAPEAPNREIGDEATAPDGPVDRREGADPAASRQLLEDIKTGMDVVREDIGDCIESWAEVSPAIDGRVVLRFQLDAEGLQDVWIEEHQAVPPGPLSCFGAAVYEVDWADITEDPLEVSFPFEVRTADTGAQ